MRIERVSRIKEETERFMQRSCMCLEERSIAIVMIEMLSHVEEQMDKVHPRLDKEETCRNYTKLLKDYEIAYKTLQNYLSYFGKK